MYLTYAEYSNMGGTLEETAFSDLSFEAESIINWYTFNRLQKMDSIPDAVKKLMFRLIGLAQLNQQAQSLGQSASGGVFHGTISNQSNDGYTTSYNVLSASDAIKLNATETKRLVDQYLHSAVDSLGRRLLYRGIYPDE